MTTSSSALQPGSLIGDLQINAILGVGTFGITYLVSDPAIGTRFALKEYLPSRHVSRQENGEVVPNDEQSRKIFATGLKLFLTEARLVAALDHPNVVKVLRYFEANGTAYFLMPYYQGQPLHHLLETSGTFDRDNARALMLPLMNALEYIHKQGIVHQDIKPANIYMTESDGPILLDFGVAAAITDGSHKLGSEGYAAPEQAEAHDLIGPWTDIYGLAATLYRCVTGRIPTAAATRQENHLKWCCRPADALPGTRTRRKIRRFNRCCRTGFESATAGAAKGCRGMEKIIQESRLASFGGGRGQHRNV